MTSLVVVSATEYTPQQMRAAMRVLDALDRGENRLISHYKHKRSHARETYRNTVTILVPVDFLGHDAALKEPIQFEVLARNLSRSGLSFVHPGELMFERLVVGLNTSPTTVWFEAHIVRKRRVEEGFWEYGATFTGRYQN